MVSKLHTPLTVAAYKSDVHNDWCPGCGDFGILQAIQQAFAELALPPWESMVFAGIGCSGKVFNYMASHGVHTLHGRVLPFAVGAKLANPNLEVIAVGGDGDGYGIGAGHFVHAGRRNVDMAYIVMTNEVYGLTKGQASPTLGRGQQTKSLPLPNTNDAIQPLALALSSGYTWIGRSYAFDGKHLKEMIKKAMEHKGMALLDVLQPCPTFNDLHTTEWFNKKVKGEGENVTIPRIFNINEQGYDGAVKDPTNADEVNEKRAKAFEMSNFRGERIPVGVFYEIKLPTYFERMQAQVPMLKQYAPALMPYQDESHLPTTDLSKVYAEYLF
jgi:2-oxoglutarate ferredoxin oxidoreductase subunit beta